MWAWFVLAACAPPEPVAPAGRVKIEELYYTGAAGVVADEHYFHDQFIELENTSEETVDLSGLLLGDAVGAAGEINPGTAASPWPASDPANVYLQSVWRLPAGVLLAPGATLVIAQDGTNHAPSSAVDLSGADFESYVEREDDRDVDHPLVPNLERVLFTGGVDWLMTVFGPTLVLIAADTPFTERATLAGAHAVFPAEAVIDAVEALMDDESGAYKRLPAEVEAGFIAVGDTYVGRSVHRRRGADGVLLDTDDSSSDFEVGAPAPWE